MFVVGNGWLFSLAFIVYGRNKVSLAISQIPEHDEDWGKKRNITVVESNILIMAFGNAADCLHMHLFSWNKNLFLAMLLRFHRSARPTLAEMKAKISTKCSLQIETKNIQVKFFLRRSLSLSSSSSLSYSKRRKELVFCQLFWGKRWNVEKRFVLAFVFISM